MSNLRISNIQRMCFHDGPGIRTTVFLKGCSLHCPWCSNPENISFNIEKGFGRDYESDVFLKEILKDRLFWEKDLKTGECGGVTFSGGEPFLQADALYEVLKKLKNENIDIAFETALFVPIETIRSIIEFIDYLIVDIKILDDETCKSALGGDLKQYYENIEWLYQQKKINMFRVPCCIEYTIEKGNKKRIIDFLDKYTNVPVQIFQLHDLAENKYQILGQNMWKPKPIPCEVMDDFLSEINKNGKRAEIIRI